LGAGPRVGRGQTDRASGRALYQSAIYEVLTIDLNALRHQRST
jgi:hypothetical protein